MKKTFLFVLLVSFIAVLSVISTFSCRMRHEPISRWQLQYQRVIIDSINAWSNNPAVVATSGLRERMNYVREHLYFSDLETMEQKGNLQLYLIPFDDSFDSLCVEQQNCVEVLVLWNRKGLPVTESGIVYLKPCRENLAKTATTMVGKLLNDELTEFTGSFTLTRIDGTIEYEKHFNKGQLVSQKTIQSRPAHLMDAGLAIPGENVEMHEWYEVNTTYKTVTYAKDSENFIGVGFAQLPKIHQQ